MKNSGKYFLLFLAGFMSMGLFQLLTRCNEEDDEWLKASVDPNELKVTIDYDAINQKADELEKALLEADQQTINELCSPEAMQMYSGKNEPYTDEELEQIGNAFKKRELVTATEVYAEFSYEFDGKQFSLTMACDDNGEWKLIRY
ncbi:MAG TPA: hypothetical protein PLK12_11025 [Prolixibacteraceae bacterium]|nr:hypothetical protein [Prolixibacteraceae bacterium]